MAIYNSLDELDTKARQQIESLLLPEESFVLAARSAGFFARFFPYFIVTNERLIRYRKLWFSEYLSDIDLARVSQVDYRTQAMGKASEIELEGPGVDEEFQFAGGDGRELATAIRAQLTQGNNVA